MKLVEPPPLDEDMKRYLLGRMTVEERDSFEERYFPEPALAEELAATETELIDAWVRGELGEEDRRAVESVLLASPAQRERVRTARALQQRQASTSVPWLALAASLAVIAGAGWWLVPRDEPRIVLTSTPPTLSKTVVPSFVFSGGQTRSEDGPRVLNVPAKAKKVRLEVELLRGDDRYRSYVVRVQTVRGAIVAEQTFARVPLAVEMPAVAGEFEMLVEGDGDLIAQYMFNIDM
jgi:anti-sigma factor RsiW